MSNNCCRQGADRQQTSTCLSWHSQKKAALHHRQWGEAWAGPFCQSHGRPRNPEARCTSQLCLRLQFLLVQTPNVSQCQRLQPFLVFLMYVHCLHICVAFWFFFWGGGGMWGGCGELRLVCPTAASLAVGWNNFYWLLSKNALGLDFPHWVSLESGQMKTSLLNGALPKRFQPCQKLNSLWITFWGWELSAPSVPFICF